MTNRVTRRFKICLAGTNEVVLGLENLPGNHPQVMRLVPVGTRGRYDMRIGEVLRCSAMGHERKGEAKEAYDLVRTA